MVDINSTCNNLSYLDENDENVSVETEDGVEYWKVSNLNSNTGAFTDIDQDSPSGEIVINSNSQYTNINNVELSISATDESTTVDEMMISNTASFAGSSWEDYSTNMSWTLDPQNGVKTVYIKFKDIVGNISSIYHDTIIFDSVAATGTLVISHNSSYTNSNAVTLDIEGTDLLSDITEMIISEDPNFIDSSWEEYSNTKEFTLSSGDGIKAIYIKYKDAAGNESLLYSDFIILDTETKVLLDRLGGVNYISDFEEFEVNDSTPTFFGTGEVDATISITINSAPISGSTIVDEDGNWAWTSDQELVLGTHTVNITSTDLAGNIDNLIFSLSVVTAEDNNEEIEEPLELPESVVAVEDNDEEVEEPLELPETGSVDFSSINLLIYFLGCIFLFSSLIYKYISLIKFKKIRSKNSEVILRINYAKD